MNQWHNKYNVQYYWSLGEVIQLLNGSEVKPWSTTTFKSLFYTNYANAPLWDSNNNTKQFIADIWQLVYSRYIAHTCEHNDKYSWKYQGVSNDNRFGRAILVQIFGISIFARGSCCFRCS